ncbi:hypothetical protein FNV62_07410 [Streptomyces sp. RLB3-17]|nr:hypothetical protein FNV67_09170 [Streptomyces sp. S1D4-20]QDN65633.1 hypothetical protein FNV66_08765 [Streptomyces sp. S1D4-14]QDN96275.1 hypothetical protein FNV58_09905 [Streptomyces sp. RLB1-9]QDO17984.1 hypothetical protein FNV65_08355 [Streptomyces sp. S1A1-8]QDO28111.1 hypothetical protein FNV63_08370 [Streptomyces sp. S1A1-3]QDO38001.1 hypothetical protein FNV62_07410 [Streptomyces sp. RLB3-17]QDO48038.1 hypothetical protein FNV60_07005 [Streptomyces sp. RLB3-5]QDO58279.1 hypothe
MSCSGLMMSSCSPLLHGASERPENARRSCCRTGKLQDPRQSQAKRGLAGCGPERIPADHRVPRRIP